MKKISVVIAEDDAMLRSLLRHILSEQEGFEVVAEIGDGREAWGAVRGYRFDVLLLDLTLPGMPGLEVLKHLSRVEHRPRVLVLSGDEAYETQLLAAQHGATGFLCKSRAVSVLAEAIRTVAAGRVWLPPEVVGQVITDYPMLAQKAAAQSSPLNQLSERELAVLTRVARGYTNQQIAFELSLSISTVKSHLHSLFRKLDLPSRTEAAVFAVREGLLEKHPSDQGQCL